MSALRWEKHRDLYVAVDKHGWKRYIVYYDGIQWEAFGPLGFSELSFEVPCKVSRPTSTNRRKLMAECAREWRRLQGKEKL